MSHWTRLSFDFLDKSNILERITIADGFIQNWIILAVKISSVVYSILENTVNEHP